MTIEGDLRFLSHLDCLRAVERIAARACVPVRMTQGFNPHPVISLACPRPVGIATRDDCVVMSLDQPMGLSDLLVAMNRCAARGMSFGAGRELPAGCTPHPRSVTYELPLDEPARRRVASRLQEIEAMSCWQVERVKKTASRRRQPCRARTIDLKELVEFPVLDATTLRWAQRPKGDMWARPEEVLTWLGLDDRRDLALVVRTAVHYDN